MSTLPSGGSDDILAKLAGLLESALRNPGRKPSLVGAGGPYEEGSMAKKALVSLDYSTDLYLLDLALLGRSEETQRKYRYILEHFCAMFEHLTPDEVTEEHCRRFLIRWMRSSPSTLALHVSILRGFFAFLKRQKIITGTPMENIDRPRRHNPEDLDIVSVSAREVRLLFDAVETWQELICLGVLCYAGVRRRAASQARWRDVDLETGMVKWREKGGKVISKPIPDELAAILRGAAESGVWSGPNDWLIPNYPKGPAASITKRSTRIVYDIVKNMGARVGVDVHCHALRAAFAVMYDETHPGHHIALKELLGHSRIETTMVYLRRKDKAAAMETVRDLSWGSSVFPACSDVPPAGFEPALPAKPHGSTVRTVTDTVRVPASLQAKLDQLSAAAKRGRVRS